MKDHKAVLFLTRSAAVAALYAVLTIVAAPISYGAIQLRVSEILTILPFYMPEAIPGLFVGCIVANIFSTVSTWDIIIGSAATLLAAITTYNLKSKWLAPIPPILFNAIFVGWEIAFFFSEGNSFWASFGFNALTVGAGEAIVCYVLGIVLMIVLEKTKFFDKIKYSSKKWNMLKA